MLQEESLSVEAVETEQMEHDEESVAAAAVMLLGAFVTPNTLTPQTSSLASSAASSRGPSLPRKETVEVESETPSSFQSHFVHRVSQVPLVKATFTQLGAYLEQGKQHSPLVKMGADSVEQSVKALMTHLPNSAAAPLDAFACRQLDRLEAVRDDPAVRMTVEALEHVQQQLSALMERLSHQMKWTREALQSIELRQQLEQTTRETRQQVAVLLQQVMHQLSLVSERLPFSVRQVLKRLLLAVPQRWEGTDKLSFGPENVLRLAHDVEWTVRRAVQVLLMQLWGKQESLVDVENGKWVSE